MGVKKERWIEAMAGSALLIAAVVLASVYLQEMAASSDHLTSKLLLTFALTCFALSAYLLLKSYSYRRSNLVLMITLLAVIFIFQSEPVGYIDQSDRPWLVILDQGCPYLFATIQLTSAIVLLVVLINSIITLAVPENKAQGGRILAGLIWAGLMLMLALTTKQFDFTPGIAVTLALWWEAVATGSRDRRTSAWTGREFVRLNIVIAGTLLLPPLLILATISQAVPY